MLSSIKQWIQSLQNLNQMLCLGILFTILASILFGDHLFGIIGHCQTIFNNLIDSMRGLLIISAILLTIFTFKK